MINGLLERIDPRRQGVEDDAGFKATASSADYAECRRLHARFGKTYYFATRCFPADKRLAVHALYGFVRCPDEWVDNPDGLTPLAQRERLKSWRELLAEASTGMTVKHPVMRAFGDTVRRYELPIDLALDFIDAMEQDIDVNRYATYSDLQAYMWGSASVIGVMMCYLMGVKEAQQHRYAAALGTAMQLTNFLRDVGEDWERNRLYLPLEDLARFKVSEAQIGDARIDENFKNLMRFEIERTRDLYQEADKGIALLPSDCQLPIRLARTLYSQILDKIEENDFDVFTRRARTSLPEKLTALWRCRN